MKLILIDDVEDLGQKGQVVDVSDGYARNFLLPRKKAVKATEGAVRTAEQLRRAREESHRQAKEEAERKAAEEAQRQSQIQPLVPQPAPSSVYYKNCTAARAAGAAPVYVGQPGYGTHLDRDRDGIGCAKLVVFCNAVEDNPFMAGAFHGIGEPDCVLNVGVSGPGVVMNAINQTPEMDFGQLASVIKRTAFKVTRMGELVGRAASEKLGIPFGIVDLSLAPTPAHGDSVARILEAMGLERVGTHGSTAALALLNDAVKKGGAMASGHVGGLSGAFIPVSEDIGMIEAAAMGAITFDKLEAMTAVCSVGLDMIAIAGDTPAETIAAIIADEAAIGMINRKTTAVRLVPAPGKTVGEHVEYGGLLGRAPVLALHRYSSAAFVRRGGRIPAPLQALNN